jgi:hypothetical protein
MYDYFEIQSKIGITKHVGGLEATRKLLKWCKVDDSDYVLVVGSGNGVSANLAWEALHIPREFNRYYGYGLYVGEKMNLSLGQN